MDENSHESTAALGLKTYVFHPAVNGCGPFGKCSQQKLDDLITNAKNTIMAPKITPQFLLFKMNSIVAKAMMVAEMMIEIPGNRINFFKSKVNSICHTLSCVAGQKQPILNIIA
jgi:hypothetical protein